MEARMKSLVAYQSHTGSTSLIAHKFYETLKAKGEADIFELKYASGRRSFFRQLVDRFLPKLAPLKGAPLDIKDYNILCIGIPVWGGRPAPLVLSYIHKCKDIRGKKVICVALYEFEASAQACLAYVKKVLQNKGPSEIIDLGIQWFRSGDEEYVNKIIKDMIDKAST
jgi:flavodoxin